MEKWKTCTDEQENRTDLYKCISSILSSSIDKPRRNQSDVTIREVSPNPQILQPTSKRYKNIKSCRPFLMGDSKKPFSINGTHLLNRKRNSLGDDENDEQTRPLNFYMYKREVIRRVQRQRELHPHHKKPNISYDGLTSSKGKLTGCPPQLIDTLRKMAQQEHRPQTNWSKRPFFSNFKFGKSCANLLMLSDERQLKVNRSQLRLSGSILQ